MDVTRALHASRHWIFLSLQNPFLLKCKSTETGTSLATIINATFIALKAFIRAFLSPFCAFAYTMFMYDILAFFDRSCRLFLQFRWFVCFHNGVVKEEDIFWFLTGWSWRFLRDLKRDWKWVSSVLYWVLLVLALALQLGLSSVISCSFTYCQLLLRSAFCNYILILKHFLIFLHFLSLGCFMGFCYSFASVRLCTRDWDFWIYPTTKRDTYITFKLYVL